MIPAQYNVRNDQWEPCFVVQVLHSGSGTQVAIAHKADYAPERGLQMEVVALYKVRIMRREIPVL